MIEKDGGCNHMTCSLCQHNFCWLCRGKWNGGCTNKLCNPSQWLDEKLGRCARVLKPPIFIVATPIVVTLGVAGGVVAGAGAIVVGTVAIPIFAVKRAHKVYKRRQVERELQKTRAAWSRERTFQQGVGMTFVGARQDLNDHVDGIDGRLVFDNRMPGEVCAGKFRDGQTRVVYSGYPLNVVFRTEQCYSYPTVAAFEGDYNAPYGVTDEWLRENRGNETIEQPPLGHQRPQIVYLCESHNTLERTLAAWQNRAETVKGRRLRVAENIRDDRLLPELVVVDLRTEIELLAPSGVRSFAEGFVNAMQTLHEDRLDEERIDGDEGLFAADIVSTIERESTERLTAVPFYDQLDGQALWELAQLHMTWVLGAVITDRPGQAGRDICERSGQRVLRARCWAERDRREAERERREAERARVVDVKVEIQS